jgi:hypothetical protein
MRYFEKQSKLGIVQKVSKGISRFTGAVTGKTLGKAQSARDKLTLSKTPGRKMRAMDVVATAEKSQKAARATVLGVGTVGAVGLLAKDKKK